MRETVGFLLTKNQRRLTEMHGYLGVVCVTPVVTRTVLGYETHHLIYTQYGWSAEVTVWNRTKVVYDSVINPIIDSIVFVGLVIAAYIDRCINLPVIVYCPT